MSGSERTLSSSIGEAELPPPGAARPAVDGPSAPKDMLGDRKIRRPGTAAIIVALTWATALPGSPFRSVGVALCLGLTAVIAVLASRRSARPLVWCAGAVAFLPWQAVRHSPWLVSVDTVMFGLLLLGAFSPNLDGRDGAPWSTAGVLRRLLGTWTSGWSGPRVVGQIAHRELRHGVAPHKVLLSVGRTLLVPLAISVLCLALLASGDALFASYLDLGWLIDSAAHRVGWAVLGLAVFVWMLGAAHAPRRDAPPPHRVTPATVQLTLAGLAITIGAYGATQLSAAVLGADYVRNRTGLTYADYARSGFFQLVIVAAIAAAAVAMAQPVVRSGHRRRSTLLVSAMVTIGVLAMVVASIVKLVVYTDRFGLTMLRLYTTVFSMWIGLVVVLTFLALLHRTGRWLVPVVLSTVVVGSFAINVANPERIVAEHNLDRVDTADDSRPELDLEYLDRLSADAAPTILAALDTLDADQRAAVRLSWCGDADNSGFGWNLSVTRAEQARADYCR